MMTLNQLLEDFIPMGAPADAQVNAKALRCMAEGIHYDTTPGELSAEFRFIMRVERVDKPKPVYRWQRSLPGVRVIHGPRPRPKRPKLLAALA